MCGVGIFACNNIKETSNAIEDEEHWMVDEEATVAARVSATREELWEATLGCYAWSWWMWNDQKSSWRIKKRHQVPPLFRLGQTGKTSQTQLLLFSQNQIPNWTMLWTKPNCFLTRLNYFFFFALILRRKIQKKKKIFYPFKKYLCFYSSRCVSNS